MQPLESRLTESKARLHGARPIGQQRSDNKSTDCVESFRGARSASRKRELPKWKPKLPLSRRQRTLRVTRLNLRNSSHSLLHLRGFARQMDQTMEYQSGSQTLLSSIAKHVQESGNIDRGAVAQSRSVRPAPPPRRCGTLDNYTDMCDVTTRGSKHEGGVDWPPNTNKVRFTTMTMLEETPQLEDTKGRRR